MDTNDEIRTKTQEYMVEILNAEDSGVSPLVIAENLLGAYRKSLSFHMQATMQLGYCDALIETHRTRGESEEHLNDLYAIRAGIVEMADLIMANKRMFAAEMCYRNITF